MKTKFKVDWQKANKKVLSSIKKLQNQMVESKEATALVGFDLGIAEYGLIVHEWTDPNVKWTTPGTGPRFLEGTLERVKADGSLQSVVRKAAEDSRKQSGKLSMESAVLAGAEHLFEVMIPVTPMDTGKLRSSAFVELE